MKPIRAKSPTEKLIQSKIRKALEATGALVRKSHGNRFQVGWPDLLVLHPEHPARWIEVKRPKTGRLTPGQRSEFEKWDAAGARIWVLTSVDQLDLLDTEPNWREWL